MRRGSGIFTTVIGESSILEPSYALSHVRRYAHRMRRSPTRAENKLCGILNNLNGGVLTDRFRQQYPISGRWIVDFFFPEVRLAIEVDGSYHLSAEQQKLDREKEADCARFDITLIRVTNNEVFGNRDHLVGKLRDGWRKAINRENQIIGKLVK